MRRIVLLSGFALVLSGCAGISKEECLYADWTAIGYEDGAAGRPVSAISSRRVACAKKAGVTVDMEAYRAGRDEGLELFCEPSNGYLVGARGSAYFGVCVGREEMAFLSAYETGRRLYELERAVAGYAADIKQAHYDLSDLDHRIAHTETALISPDTPHGTRVELLAELKHLSEERGRIETAIVGLNRKHARAEDDLADYRAMLAYDGANPGAAGVASRVSY